MGRYSPPHFQALALLFFFPTPLFFFLSFRLTYISYPPQSSFKAEPVINLNRIQEPLLKLWDPFPFWCSPPPCKETFAKISLSLHLGFLPLPPLPSPSPLAPFPPQLAVSTFGRNYFCLPNLPTSSAPCCWDRRELLGVEIWAQTRPSCTGMIDVQDELARSREPYSTGLRFE